MGPLKLADRIFRLGLRRERIKRLWFRLWFLTGWKATIRGMIDVSSCDTRLRRVPTHGGGRRSGTDRGCAADRGSERIGLVITVYELRIGSQTPRLAFCCCSPVICPSLSSMDSEQGACGKPGIRTMSPVKATRNPAPALIWTLAR